VRKIGGRTLHSIGHIARGFSTKRLIERRRHSLAEPLIACQ
jgi:hypothetical protein